MERKAVFMEHEVKISVKNLVEFILSSGNIDNRFTAIDRAMEGAKIHRCLQKEGGEGYKAEVSLGNKTLLHTIWYLVEGRADGIIEQKDKTVIIDEIKTTTVPYEQITEDFNIAHWAQAKCYGYFYCLKAQLDFILIQLTYFQVDIQKIKRFQIKMTVEELKIFYEDLLLQYEKWALHQINWITKRNETIRNLNFPFPSYRKGQRQMAAFVYRTIQNGGKFFCQAPTGIGKTVSTLFPAIKALEKGYSQKIFYLTAKTITRQVAYDTIKDMEIQGLKLKTIVLTAKDKVCFLEERNCNPEVCPYAKNYFDKIKEALYDMLQNCDLFTRESMEFYGKKYMICPFEAALDLSLWCDVIIGDYNYLFDPVVNLKRFFSDKKGDSIFLIDEAHNLVNRAREMYSASLNKSHLFQLKKSLGKEEKILYQSLGKINTELIKIKKLCNKKGELVQKQSFEELNRLLSDFSTDCAKWLEEHKQSSKVEEILTVYFEVNFYRKIAEFYDDRYVTVAFSSKKEFIVRQLCLDASLPLAESMKKGRATILFSATLSPLNYFGEVLGGEETDKKAAFYSPFLEENRKLIIAGTVDVRYYARQKSIPVISRLIFEMAKGKKGNYMVFFPSYQYMNEVYEYFKIQHTSIHTIIQMGNEKEEEREQFLNCFAVEQKETLVGFCVLGGIYAEGIDLKGDRLIGTMIVGVGLPQLSTEQNIIKEYYDSKNGMGYEFSYQFPGMNKVLQAGGRVIRGEQEKGVIILVDNRYLQQQYLRLFPPHWSRYSQINHPEELKELLDTFWITGK